MANRLSATTQSTIWMAVAMVFFSYMPIIVRYLSDTIPAIEQVFFRGVFATVLMLPWMLRGGLYGLRTERLGLIGVRSVFIGFGVVSWFYAIALMPLAEATALHFTLPLFGIVLAMLFLGERARAHRWIATAIGCSGVVVILRPGLVAFDTVALVVLFSALCYAVGTVVTKTLVRTEPPDIVVFYMNLYALPLFIVPTVIYWVTPSMEDWLLLGALAATTLIAHICITRALALADASFLFPFDFVRLPLTGLAAYILFAEVPDIWTIAGGVIIFGSAYYVTVRERAEEQRENIIHGA